jgi:hypothetical protein
VQTQGAGSALGVTFTDGTTFNPSANNGASLTLSGIVNVSAHLQTADFILSH